MLLKAQELQAVDREYEIHRQAFENFRVRGTKGKGKHAKPVYSQFDKFFNYKKAVDEVMGKRKTDKYDALKQHLRKKGEKENGRSV